MTTISLVILITITCTSGQFNTTSVEEDLFEAFNSELEFMDWVWLIYAAFALVLSLCCITPIGIFYHLCCKSEKYDALTKECYDEILNARGYDGNKTAVGDKRPLSLLVLRQDLKEKRIWHHDWKKDFMLFLRNEHALFSTCFSHPDHPFSRR
eukprot:882359_1